MSDSINIEEGVEESTPLSLDEIIIQTENLFQEELKRILIESTTSKEEDYPPF